MCNGFVVRDNTKGYGLNVEIEGYLPEKDEPTVIVDDVLTTGASVLRTASIVEGTGAKVVAVCVMVDREEGGRGILESCGYRVYPCFTLSEIREIKRKGKWT